MLTPLITKIASHMEVIWERHFPVSFKAAVSRHNYLIETYCVLQETQVSEYIPHVPHAETFNPVNIFRMCHMRKS